MKSQVKKAILGVAVLVAFGTWTVSSSDIAVADKSNRPIYAAAQAAGFNTLAKAIQVAKLQNELNTGGPYTVFAPTDEAFAKIPAADLEALLADPAKLASILKYHVVEGTVTSGDVVRLNSASTLNGAAISIEVVGGGVVLNGSVNVTDVDIMAKNGVIHVIDTVLLP